MPWYGWLIGFFFCGWGVVAIGALLYWTEGRLWGSKPDPNEGRLTEEEKQRVIDDVFGRGD